ncbi:hypothetical protein ABW21_db0204110 [Orbilia brochopaga]|nr:hypothetical protein ABW21_db0204110 [Drechslerella brochopaga]
MPPRDAQICSPSPSDTAPSGLLQHDTVLELFGGSRDWLSEQWTASDDRVRGGQSQSYLHISEKADSATFCGNLDIETLGGAGFASQRTTAAAGGPWDLSNASGLCIGIEDADERIYTIVVKDVILPKRPDGREQSTISYEFSFSIRNQQNEGEESGPIPTPLVEVGQCPSLLVSTHSKKDSEDEASLPIVIFIPWANFKPYYRGRKNSDAPPLKTTEIQCFSIMCRSMFGSQFGDFSITIKFISALRLNNDSHKKDVLYYPLHLTDSTDGTADSYIMHRLSSRAIDETQQPKAASMNIADQKLIGSLEKLKVEECSTSDDNIGRAASPSNQKL